MWVCVDGNLSAYSGMELAILTPIWKIFNRIWGIGMGNIDNTFLKVPIINIQII